MKKYKAAEGNFVKALESLRKSSVPNEEKAAVAGRISTVFKMVKEENKPKNKSKETAKILEETKNKKKGKKKEDNITSEDSGTLEQNKLPDLPKVSYGKNSKLENASGGVMVVQDKNRGRSVIATRDIEPGQNNYAIILHNNYNYTIIILAELLS